VINSGTYAPYNLLFLKRLVGDRGVVLQARELGPAVPISYEPAICAQFFWPWSLHCRIGATSEQVWFEVPLSEILARGCAPQVLLALGQTSSWLLRTLVWPHSALCLFVTGNESAARNELTSRLHQSSFEMADWQAAGVYFTTLFQDLAMARACLEKSASVPNDQSPINHRSLAWNWLKLCGDKVLATSSLHAGADSSALVLSDDTLSWFPPISRAAAWMELFGLENMAREQLDLASRAARPIGSGGLFPTAIAWMSILGDQDKATELAGHGMSSKSESLRFAVLYWCCIANNPEKAQECLWSKQWSDYSSDHFRLNLAQCLVLFNHLGRGREYQQHAEALVKEVLDEDPANVRNYCRAAELCSALDPNGTELISGVAQTQVQECCDALEIAKSWRRMWHITPDAQLSVVRKVLTHAETLADNAMDFYFCARSWRTVAGDEDGTRRCLTKGQTCTRDAQDMDLLKQGWRELLGEFSP
jgi:hypothetical protein